MAMTKFLVSYQDHEDLLTDDYSQDEFDTREEAEQRQDELQNDGFENIILEEMNDL